MSKIVRVENHHQNERERLFLYCVTGDSANPHYLSLSKAVALNESLVLSYLYVNKLTIHPKIRKLEIDTKIKEFIVALELETAEPAISSHPKVQSFWINDESAVSAFHPAGERDGSKNLGQQHLSSSSRADDKMSEAPTESSDGATQGLTQMGSEEDRTSKLAPKQPHPPATIASPSTTLAPAPRRQRLATVDGWCDTIIQPFLSRFSSRRSVFRRFYVPKTLG
jgi:hypothetical protein